MIHNSIDCPSETTLKEPILSAKGQTQAEKGKAVLQFNRIISNAYDPITNPEGIVNFGVAENALMKDELKAYYESKFSLTHSDFSYGDAITGTTRLRSAVCSFLNSRFKPHLPVMPDHLVMGAGLSPVLNQVARVLGNPGDAVLIAAPYFSGFDNDFVIQNDVIPVPVHVPISEMFTLQEVNYLELSLQESERKGKPVKAVILCNPHNPLGRTYPPGVITAYCRFCEKHNLHLISDEIYAFSVFPSRDMPDPQPFVSVLSVDLASIYVNPARVHVVYGMSKDFNANGFRIGLFVSQANPKLIQSLTVGSFFMLVASPAASLWSAILTDTAYLDAFLSRNQKLRTESYEYLTAWLQYHKIPYVPSSAGHFLMINLGTILSDVERYGPRIQFKSASDMREREGALYEFLITNGVVVGPGAGYHMEESGWFRFTFAVRCDFVRVGLQRMEDALGWERWPELERDEKSHLLPVRPFGLFTSLFARLGSWF